MKSRIKEQGSVVHIVVVVVLVVALLGALGFIFWQNFIHPANSGTTAKTDTTTEKSVAKEQAYTIDDAVAGINQTLSIQGCSFSTVFKPEAISVNDFKQVSDSASFNYQGGVSLISNDLTYSYAQYGCGSSGEIGLLKKVDSAWKLVTETGNIYPQCDAIRGQGFPASIINKCLVDNSGADPVAI